MAEFFDMGGFENYIWSSYSFAVICLGWLNYASWRKAKTTAPGPLVGTPSTATLQTEGAPSACGPAPCRGTP